MLQLKVENLGYQVRQKVILQDVSLEVYKGEFIGIIGPNGSGKSSLLKNIYKMLVPDKGNIYLEGQDLLRMSSHKMAQHLAVVAQENDANFDFTVREVVQMGRYPRKKLLETVNQQDAGIVQQMLKKVQMEQFIDRSFLSLSGGEKQRVLIARALAQETEMIILDEPTNHLDIGSQIKTLNLLKQTGKTVLTALHDLSIAARYCDRIYVLKDGRSYADGKTREIINSRLVEELYHLKADVFMKNGRLFVDYD
ncbi:MAG: ABC transporter ATP-binding protein [Muricoprocola sp.]